MFKRQLSVVLICAFVFSLVTPIYAVETHSYASLPAPGQMVSLSAAYQPAIIRGITVHKDNPFLFDFIVDTGDVRNGRDRSVRDESLKLIKYFLATLAIPEKDLWVNLSPYEKSRIIPNALGQTDMGRDLLAQDYLLKQITASLIYPEKGLGKEFWNRVYAKVQEKYGNIQIPVNAFNKVWIMGDSAQVYVKGNSAFVSECHLKVMLEEDYLAQNRGQRPIFSKNDLNFKNRALSPILRDLILPELEREVNQGKHFANLRQIFNSIILASWYKNSLKESILNQTYANQSKVKGIDLEDKNIKQKIYNQYLQAYKKGVFNYIKDETSPTGAIIPRKYFSGGVSPAMATQPRRTLSHANVQRFLTNALSVVLIAVNLSIKLSPKPTGPNIQQMPYPYTIPKIASPMISDAAMPSPPASIYDDNGNVLLRDKKTRVPYLTARQVYPKLVALEDDPDGLELIRILRNLFKLKILNDGNHRAAFEAYLSELFETKGWGFTWGVVPYRAKRRDVFNVSNADVMKKLQEYGFLNETGHLKPDIYEIFKFSFDLNPMSGWLLRDPLGAASYYKESRLSDDREYIQYWIKVITQLRDSLRGIAASFESMKGIDIDEVDNSHANLSDRELKTVDYYKLLGVYLEGFNNYLGQIPRRSLRLNSETLTEFNELIEEQILKDLKNIRFLFHGIASNEASQKVAGVITASRAAIDQILSASGKDVSKAMAVDGGIDLQASRMKWDVKADAAMSAAVAMPQGEISPSLWLGGLEQIRLKGIESLTPEIIGITPVKDIEALIRKGG